MEDNKWLPLALFAVGGVIAYIFWPKSAKAMTQTEAASSGPIDLANITGIQKALTALGYKPGKIDGKYGPSTKSAVNAFQKAHGLGVDAVIGHDTRAAMAADLKAKGISILGESGPTIRGVGIISY